MSWFTSSDRNVQSKTPSSSLKKRYQHPLSLLGGSLIMGMMSLPAAASNLISSTEYLDYSIPTAIQERCTTNNNCPDIEVKYLQSSQAWINQIINQRINGFVVNAKPSEAPTNPATSSKAVKAALDDFARSSFEDMPDDRVMAYNLMVAPEYLGHINTLELFDINSYVFTGGAHGMAYSEYLILDHRTKQPVTLSDMLVHGKNPRFEALAKQAYKQWVKTVADNPADYEKSWPFMLSDDITLTEKGMDIRYSLYAISPYAYGMPVLSIPYSQLRGVIKPQFLPQQ